MFFIRSNSRTGPKNVSGEAVECNSFQRVHCIRIEGLDTFLHRTSNVAAKFRIKKLMQFALSSSRRRERERENP